MSITFAFIGTICLVLIIVRSVLKRISFKYPQSTITKRGYLFLTKIHPPLGIIAVISILIHCYLLPDSMKNLILYILLVAMIIQGILGVILKNPKFPTLRRMAYKIHSKYILIILIIILALLGHSI